MNKQMHCGEIKKDWRKLDLLTEYSLLTAVFCLALLPAVSTAALVVSVLLWLLKVGLTNGRCFKRMPFDKWVLFFLAAAGLSITVSPDRGFSVYNYTVLVGQYAAFYYVTLQSVTTMAQLKRLFGVLLAASFIAIAYGYYQFFFGIDVSQMLWVDDAQFPDLKTRVFSTWQNPNIFAGYLLVVISLAIGVAVKARARSIRILLGTVAAAGIVCLGMTYCRGAWITLALMIGGYTLRFDRRLFALLAIAGCCVVAAEPSIQQRLFSAFTIGDTSAEMRLGMWESTLAMIIDRPFLGIGWGAYWLVYPEYDFYINNPAVVIVHAHNMYLNLLAETGFFGFGAFMLCMLGHLNLGVASVNLRSSAFLNGLTLGIVLSILCIMVNGVTDYVLFNIELSKLYWFLNAVLVVICRRELR